MTDTRRRVKLYALNADRQWDDRGTGHVSSSYVDRLHGMSLLVRAESDGSILLESKILPDTAYQKQQETLIVWSEGENYDLALSFQEKIGCDEIWAKICQVQGKDPSVDITQDLGEEEDDRYDDASDMSSLLFELPPCEIDRLDEINEIIATCLPFQAKREKLANLLERETYIKKMLDLFHICEEIRNINALHKLYEIFKNIFMLNKTPLLDVMLGDEALLFDVVGVFEYDPSQPQPKRHRDFLRSGSRFKQVIPFGNSELVHKIHQTYRVQYIQDVVLPTPSVLEDNMISNLNSFIFFNKVEIVNIIQEDDKFLRELFSMITDESTDDEKRRDLVLFLKEFCIFSQNLQPQNRDAFFKALSSLGILPTLEVTLAMDDMVIKTSSVDILTYIVEFSASMVREYALQQSTQADEEQFIVNIIIEQMICDPDPDLGMAVQLSSALRSLLDPDNMLATGAISKSEKTEFLNYFYKHCMHVLVSRLLACGENKAGMQSAQQAQLCSLILELLSFCVEHHTYQIRAYIVQNDLLRKALQLVKTKHRFLILSVLRFMRRIIGLKDENYCRYIINENLFEPIIEVFTSNKGRYNLLDSAIIEMFEFIRAEEIKILCVHIIDKFGRILDKIDYVRTFKELRRQYEQHQDRIDRGTLENTVILRNNRFRRDARQMDEDEEMWFNNDEEEVDEIDPNTNLNLNDSLNYKLDADFEFNKKMEKKATLGCLSFSEIENVKKFNDLDNVKGNANTNNKANAARRTTVGHPGTPNANCLDLQVQIKGLVDYEGDSDDEEEEESENNELLASKRTRLNS